MSADSTYFDNEFKAILCHQSAILTALGSMLFGMNMYNKGLQYNYVFESFTGNNSKRYTQSDLFVLANLAATGRCNGGSGFTEDIDKEYICLIQHAKIYMSVITSVRMARQALADGKSYIFAFTIPKKGNKNYGSSVIIKLSNEATNMSNCCADVDDDCITRCTSYFGCTA